MKIVLFLLLAFSAVGYAPHTNADPVIEYARAIADQAFGETECSGKYGSVFFLLTYALSFFATVWMLLDTWEQLIRMFVGDMDHVVLEAWKSVLSAIQLCLGFPVLLPWALVTVFSTILWWLGTDEKDDPSEEEEEPDSDELEVAD